jgi:putative ABC transport system permease protein
VLIFLLTTIVSMAFDIDVFLSLTNIFRGLLISALIGLISGFIPALIASRMDPVEAIRS